MESFTKLETSRLLLRRFQISDLEAFMAYRNNPEVARYQGWESVSATAARRFIEEMSQSEPGRPGEWFQFAIGLKLNSALIGDCALHINEDEPRQAEIGFTLAPPFQGQGYAGEAVSCLLDFAFLQLHLHRIIAITDVRNSASVRLLERLGMRREGHFIQNVWFKGAWGDEYLYAILKHEWEE